MSALHDLARAAGLSRDWKDASGKEQRVSDDTLVAVLEALGLPADSEARIRDSLARLREEAEPEEPAAEPARGFAPPGRLWGPAVQITSLRDRRGAAFGDFGALASFAAAAARSGADLLAMSPVHALFPGDPNSFSPYGPSTRLFLNVLLGDPSLLGDEGGGCDDDGDLIDWQRAIPERMKRLRGLYDARSEATEAKVAAFAAAEGEPLRRHAIFDALFARFGTGWQDWPAEYRDCSGAAVARFAAEQAEEVGFYIFLQWLADASLARAQRAARDGGMKLGLIADMAVGMSPGGSQAWSRPEGLLQGLSVGAPPDPLGPDGQDWGITTFSPRGLKATGYRDFTDTIRAALRHAGGIRIDHAMSLRRLWVIPRGAPATEGVYLAYPQGRLMDILAEESRRAETVVVGEDLGTVPLGFREEMEARNFLGMRVLWFERTGRGGFRKPESYSKSAAAMTSTHDLPTVAGWWSGRDIDWGWKIGRTSAHDSEAAERAAREQDKARLKRAFRGAGIDPGDPVGAACAFVAQSASDLAIIPAEDLIGEPEQPNLPGTIDEHPNWRRRLPGLAEDMLSAPDVAARIVRINEGRGA
ncbi:MAG: 4-alpha-glucanotransferase [Allosphingosinicella sp.]|uniref:4-alpha-glucanotransferase n=1 Tax=Allosphingosinicella sp. TaxID=2823234 RepID=UPI00395DB773